VTVACPICELSDVSEIPTTTPANVQSLITAESSLRFASPKTVIPNNTSQFGSSGPLIVNPFIVTSASLLTSTIYGRPITLVSKSSNGSGASIIVDFAPDPIIVRLLTILSCSV
jgi:hypothetical protein